MAKAFLTISTQWRRIVLPNGKLLTTGLDYAGVKPGLKFAGIKISPALWTDLQVIEIVAMAALNED